MEGELGSLAPLHSPGEQSEGRQEGWVGWPLKAKEEAWVSIQSPMRKGQRGAWSGREETLRPDQSLPSMNFPDKNTRKTVRLHSTPISPTTTAPSSRGKILEGKD